MIQFEVITDGTKTLNQINERYENDFKQYVGSDCEIEIQVMSFEEFQGAYFAKFLGLVKTVIFISIELIIRYSTHPTNLKLI